MLLTPLPGIIALAHAQIRELKQRRRRQLRKRHLKSEFALLQTLSRLLHLVYFVKCWQMFLELNSKGLYQSSGKEKESCCLVFPSSTKREIRHFHVVVVQRRLRNGQKSVIHVQSCCSSNLNKFLFCWCRCRRHRRCINSLLSRLDRVWPGWASQSVYMVKSWPGRVGGGPYQQKGWPG